MNVVEHVPTYVLPVCAGADRPSSSFEKGTR